jgi:ABC-type uncharacterized transport system ATPase subunit
VTDTLARLSGIERRFGSVAALAGASLEIAPAEIHGVLGANGAGKSTLLHILGGMIQPDAGEIEIQGQSVMLRTPRDAWRHGIALVHQHFTLVPALSGLENLALGSGTPVTVGNAVDEIMERTGLRVPLDEPVSSLGIGDRQRLEILKALLREPTILVLDEPTAVLSPAEVQGLFTLLRTMAAEGCAVVLVAHKLREVLGVADRLTVLRDGRTVATDRADAFDEPSLVRAMVGGEVEVPAPQSHGASGEHLPKEERTIVGSLTDVRVVIDGVTRLDSVSMTMRRGEILGVTGIEGNGQRELALVLAGRQRPAGGSARLPSGIGFVPQDRLREGLIPSFDLVENVALALHQSDEYLAGPWMRWDDIRGEADRIVQHHGVVTTSTRTLAGALSGGNQQRVVVGREVAMATDLLVAENPTRGLDMVSATFVHAELRRLASAGVSIVLISTDLDEVLDMSTSVYAMSRGVLREVTGNQRTRTGVGALMLSGPADE